MPGIFPKKGVMTKIDSLVLSSGFDELHRIEPYLKEIREKVEMDDEQFGRVMLTLSEAVTNAILHGNRQDPEKEVTVASRHTGNTLTITVQDEGEGFDPEKLSDPLKEENLLNEGGRGVFLIKQYADRVSYSRNGTRLTISFEMD